jgi:hypothetical protein
MTKSHDKQANSLETLELSHHQIPLMSTDKQKKNSNKNTQRPRHQISSINATLMQPFLFLGTKVRPR